MVGCWLGLGWAGRVGVLGALIFGDVSGLALGAGGGAAGLAWGLTGQVGADVFIRVCCMCRGRR